ncbi:MAG: hypothetical protein F2917_03330 [Actinobacteria bacterium]|uniref:Unannotated protein n=1 Tax=freshwater metagenome TaxID=449393 RepID=A0A6J6ADZ5_9ZZZZ|nr:hypothetical protein [Actinomycetota bacterium]
MSDRQDRTSEHGESPEILVGIMHVTRDPWLSITRDGQLPSWKKSKFQNFSVVYFFSSATKLTTALSTFVEWLRWNKYRYASYAIQLFLLISFRPWIRYIPTGTLVDQSESKINALALKVNIPELISTMRWKKLAFLKYFLEETSADFVIISTASSILNMDLIVEILSKLKNTDQPLYGGKIHHNHKVQDFASGSFTVLNRKSAALLLENTLLMPVHTNDDISFGMAFERLGIQPIDMKSLDFASLEMLREVPRNVLSEVPHFRLKSGPLGSRGDVEIMRELCDEIYP